MVIKLTADLESALNKIASARGVTPELVAVNALRAQFLAAAPVEPRDDWERNLLALARDCGVSLSHSAVSSEGLYE